VKIERYEKYFMIAVAVFLGLAVGALILTITQDHAALPEPADRVDPQLVRSTPPFDEPGVREIGDNEYEVVMTAAAWQWTPNEITLPAGATVQLTVTSVDVVHGMRIPDTNVNAMIIPGQVTEVTLTFDDPGEYSLICHEYCGIGHHNMGGRFTIVDEETNP
jgi:cytochrome c oxidase subunit 2